MSQRDTRCCGSGTCIINEQGECWCGQVWDGEKMVVPKLEMNAPQAPVKDQAQSSED
ncbi:hypothetical protein ICE94_01385 [Polynucleobacter sp. MWH-Loch1C5]|jgi:hypothetical protein|uniref:hypothetical protein n=1 Tax=Polynucleobacter sp. MWH-Loch1C5 TaxID=2689108 RepID=UPI001C0DD1AE|nr:hypothetical protein [Polynucleobacter sp. MWH-Loch1C5]MBU3541924.1 hypothetical protein [Polynucleobacter sp. MWH-Loch1C5]